MSKLAGYVIVRGEEPNIEVFEGFRASLTHSKILVDWGKPFLGRGVERFALYKDHMEAEEARQHPQLAGGRVEPLLIGPDTANDSWMRWIEEKEGREDAFMSASLTELIETGSVTIHCGDDRHYVISLRVKEVNEEGEPL